uniref:non-specific serine/threonine protein kinase n=1 Tax=Brassica campestris TaxID=3711 RepID=M4CQI6_BRACM
MNQYHIYEAIGHGKCSTVYKGRKKKTIEYFACKSVDKSRKSKVLQEVRILHSLNHPNVLKFYAWYETSAHMWLVLEYCVGGDLRTLLQQDCKLPEDSVYGLAYDLVIALLFLHSKGITYCDLKPSNILLDENGHIKLCDFGLARKLDDITKSPSTGKRGTPYYMAPELYEDGGVHSFASDLWALGCVLYECYTGKPPFVAREFTQLVKSIHSDPTPPLPGNASRSFANLIESLLIKDPAQRIQWADLCGHAFWKSKINSVQLPPQPAFDNMIGIYTKPCLSEHNGDRPCKTPQKSREKDPKGGSKHKENSTQDSRGHETPQKGTPVGLKTQTKFPSKATEEKHGGRPGAKRQVNILRLSRIAKANLQKENEKENYRRPLPNSNENCAEVKIDNTDMELDFDEHNDEDGPDESEGNENTSRAQDERVLSQNESHRRQGVRSKNVPDENSSANGTPTSGEARGCHEEQSEPIEVSAALLSASPQVKTHRGRDVSGINVHHDSSKSPYSLSDVLWHLSDLSVRPVMPSRKSDKEAVPSLSFEAPRPSDFGKMRKQELEPLNNRIITVLSGSSASISEKQNLIRYLETLSTNADAANILTNGPIMLVLVKVLRLSKTPAFRVQIASLIGLLIRHSTAIEDELANSGILDSLTNGLRDKHEKVRRFSMAALGELLFYISTQNEHKDSKPTESPSKETRSTSGWQVSSALISLVSSMLRKGEDDLTQLYALRTIENFCSQGGYWASRFSSQDVISNLCYIYRAAGKQESIRQTAGSCLGRDDFRITLLQVLECIAEEAPLVTQNAEIIIREVLPSLAAIYNGNKDGDARFLCLKIWFDSMTILLTECTQLEQQTSEDLKSVSNSHFLPLYPALLQDEDPIPAYARKLLLMLVEFDYIKISSILHQNTVSQCFEFLLGDLSSANVNNVKLCLALASAPEMETKLLSQLRVVRRIGNLLEFVNAKDMEDFLEPTLSLCRAFLLRSLGNKKGLRSNYTKEPTLLSEASFTFEVDPQECVRDIADFGSNIGLFLDLAASDDTSIAVADIASECVVLLLKAASREAAMGFLTNLPKITPILDSWRRRKSTETQVLVLTRILHCLGYACKQYLSHAMILSIPGYDIYKINAIVSEIKNSDVAGLNSVASLVAVELQRLPR